MKLNRNDIRQIIMSEVGVRTVKKNSINEHDQDMAGQLDPKLISIAHEEAQAHLTGLENVIGAAVYEIVSHCTNSGNQSSTDDMYSAACVVIERMIDKIFDTHRTTVVRELSDELSSFDSRYAG